MNIDMRIGHAHAGCVKGGLHAVHYVVVCVPVILRPRPEAQDVIDGAVAVAGHMRLDGAVRQDLFAARRRAAERFAYRVRIVVIGG